MQPLNIKPFTQQDLFSASPDPPFCKSISVYRVSLVKDESVSFGNVRLANSQEAQALIQNLILTKGQPDREQFVVALLNAKNELTGLNIVSVGGLSSAPVHPREVLKPAILANSAAMILAHNHPSNDLEPSPDDIDITRKIIRAAEIVGIQVHEHLIISMENDRYYSFADHGTIARMNPDHYRNVIWTRALDKAGLEYRPPIQTRHSFATMMLSTGEDVGWVQNMLGHSSLQMIFTRYYAWVPRKTRNDGAAFLASVGQIANQEKEGTEANSSAKVIELFPKATQKRHTTIKKGHGEKP